MRRYALVLALMVLGLTSAQTDTQTQTAAPAMTLNKALELSPDVAASVLTARATLSAAQRDLARVQADPLALRLDQLQAEQAVASAQSAVDTTLAALRLNTAQAYFDALEADDTLEVAQQQRDIAATTLQATQIRRDAGAATDLDLVNAQNDLAADERALQDATLARDLAYQNLSSLVGTQIQSLQSVTPDDLTQAPSEAEALAEAENKNAQLLAAERAVALTQTQLEAVDNAFSARADIQAAQDALASAQTTLTDIRSTLSLTLRQRYNALTAAQSSLTSAEASYASSQDNLAAQQVRLDAGSISPLDLAAAQLGALQSRAALASALHAAWLATLQLEQTVVGQ